MNEYCSVTGKLIYVSRYEAHIAREKIRKKGEKGPQLYVYKCPYCKRIHLTQDRQGTRDRRRRREELEDDSLEIGG